MAKDRKARADHRLTIMVIGNLYAALVDTMRAAEVPTAIIHGFLDQLSRRNEQMTWGVAEIILEDIIAIIRDTVPAND